MSTPIDEDAVFIASTAMHTILSQMGEARKKLVGYRDQARDFTELAQAEQAKLQALLPSLKEKAAALSAALKP